MIADETVGTDVDAVRAHLEKVGHPALAMWDITAASPEAAAADAARWRRAERQPAPPVRRSAEPDARPPRRLRRPPSPVRPAPPVWWPRSARCCATGARSGPPAAAPPSGLEYVISVLDRLRHRTAADPGAIRHDAGAADGRAAGVDGDAPAARRRQHAADVQRRALGRSPLSQRRRRSARAGAVPPLRDPAGTDTGPGRPAGCASSPHRHRCRPRPSGRSRPPRS